MIKNPNSLEIAHEEELIVWSIQKEEAMLCPKYDNHHGEKWA